MTYVGGRAASSLLVARATEDVDTADTDLDGDEAENRLLHAVAALG